MAKKSKGKKGRRAVSGTGVISGHCTPGTLSLASASGVFVINSWDIDTQFCDLWNELSTVFQRWKLLKLSVKVTPIRGTGTVGDLTACVQEDDPSSAPTTFEDMISQRVSGVTNNTQPLNITWRPKHNMWCYTGDNVTSDDRWEMLGRLHVASAEFTSAVIPALVSCHYRVMFDTVTVPTTATFLPKHLAIKRPEKTGKSEEDDCPDLVSPYGSNLTPPIQGYSVESKLAKIQRLSEELRALTGTSTRTFQ